MINLNLLSQVHKDNLRVRVLYSMIERLMILFITLVLLISGGLFALKLELGRVHESIVERQLLSTEYVMANKDIKALNAGIARIERVGKAFVPASLLLKDITKRTPAGATLTGVDFETKTNSLQISGFALTRDDLLAFEAGLRGSPYVKQLDSQLSNLLLKRDITFQLKAILATDKLMTALEPQTP